MIFLLWIYDVIFNFCNHIFNLKAKCRAYILRSLFNSNVSSLGVYENDGSWLNLFDYESEKTIYLISLFIGYKLGIVNISYKLDIDKINTEVFESSKYCDNPKFCVTTLYVDGIKLNVIISKDIKKTINYFKINIGYAILGESDITRLLKGYQPYINYINISVSELIVILRNKHEINIKDDAVLTIFNVDNMEEQTLKGDDIINI